ncbi:MAG: FecR domain-containing protein [Candidatus Eremiobacteraeota bacterium]|nr:FecR domain-containing protein [Candidatus Eremiobacteraeota bacterium]
MKALSSTMLALSIAALPIVCSPATTDKTLKTVEGNVTYGASSSPTTKLAKNASTSLADNDYTQTGGNSMATITLPDSSVVTVGANSNVQMKSFDNAGGTNTANFVVVGKMRFQVEHPAGAKANYTFQTPTGQIAVRGTVGDIFATLGQGGAPGGLQVNVYALTNPALPVQVTLVNGQVFTLAAGQSLVVTSAAGAVVGSVGAVSNTTFAPFSQLGAPANASSLGITSTATTAATGAAAAGSAAAATTAAAAAVGAAAVVTTTAANNSKGGSTPAPSPTPSSTSVPITVSGHPGIAPVPATIPATIPSMRLPHPLTRPTPPAH